MGDGKKLIDIRDFRIRPSSWQVIHVARESKAESNDSAWMHITELADFRAAFDERNRLNIPGPFYGAVTDTCHTGPDEAPNNVLVDRNGQEFVFRQPCNEQELMSISRAACCDPFRGS